MSEPEVEVLHEWRAEGGNDYRIVKDQYGATQAQWLGYAARRDGKRGRPRWHDAPDFADALEPDTQSAIHIATELARLAATVKALREEKVEITDGLNAIAYFLAAGEISSAQHQGAELIARLTSEDEVVSAPIHEDPELPREMPGMDREAKGGSQLSEPTNKPASPDLAERIAQTLLDGTHVSWEASSAVTAIIRDSLAPVRTALEKAEWVYDPTPNKSRQWFCPVCDNVKPYGHAEGCALAAAILLLLGERP